jgi:pimeloyl-ACP methyl ester carboxylesterase
MMREQEFRTSVGLTLNVADSETSGAPVVFLHGVTRRWQDWLGVIPLLVPSWRCIAIDARGHGRSDRVPGAYRQADYVPDLVDYLRLGLSEPAVMIGHSLGGNLATALAAEAPERVRAVVLEDPPLVMAGPRLADTPFLSTFRVFIRHAGSDRPVSEIAAAMAEARVQVPGRAELVRFGDVRDAVSLRFSATCLKHLDPEVLQWPLNHRWLEGSDVESTLGRIEAPTLLIQADPSVGGILPDAEAKAAATRIRECLHVKLPGIGHNIHSTATEAFMRLVLPFLGSLE